MSHRTYRKNDLHVSTDDRARIDARWAFAFAELRYRTEAGV